MKKILAAVMLATVFSDNANAADYTVKQYRDAKESGGADWSKMMTYLAGAESGFMNANVWIVGQKQPGFYCQPPTFGLTIENVTTLIDLRLSELGSKVLEDYPVSQYLMFALIKTFPCPK